MSKFFTQFGIDPRLLGMIFALLGIWLIFHFLTDGRFLTPRNLYNLSVQSASVAIMACGMVFVIVARHIDLSVGSMLGFIGMIMGAIQLHVLPDFFGHGSPAIWVVTVFIGLSVGAAAGSLQGVLIGYAAIPSFIVTLGGFLVWRGAAWWVTSGQTVAPLDPTFKLLGGGAAGNLGELLSLIFGIGASIFALCAILMSRRQRQRHGFNSLPISADVFKAVLGVSAILIFVLVMNSYEVPARAAQRIAEARGFEIDPTSRTMRHGIAIPVLIVLLVASFMTVVATRTPFGRAIFAVGGNPDAAALSGIRVRLLTVKIFALMGMLTALSSVVATARLQSAANDLGTLDELRVIAAAVIGGTALSGGVGTIYGATLGAIIMQSLQSGMAMVGVDAPLQSIVVGFVLVLAVFIDIQYRKTFGD